MDIPSKKRFKIIALNEHTLMAARDIVAAVGVGKSSVSGILRTFSYSGTSSSKRRGKCGRKRKTTPRTEKILIQNCKINPMKTSIDLRKDLVTAVAEWFRYRTVACFVTGSSPVPLKTRRVGQRCTLNLSRAETSSRWCGVVVRRGGSPLRCRPRHLTMVQNYVVRRQKPSFS
ncbi:uncharacterized protein TNCV_2041161 [Trichonephila clavipes]|nr:uncharacterized protein TNCV_2041161 [Trichonephila clavipes]